jgi:hypothetical protein
VRYSTTHTEAQQHGVKIINYGGPGVGKTPLCATAPDPIIISAEAGLLSLGGAQDIPTIVIEQNAEADLIEAYKFIAYSDHAKRFSTVCLDSWTEIADRVLADLKTKKKDPRQAYGEMFDKMLAMTVWFRDLPGKHVYFTSQMEWQKDEITNLMMYLPSMPGQKLGPKLPYMFDEVLNMDVAVDQTTGNKFSYLRCRRTPQYFARDRSGKLSEYEEPHLGKLIEKILSGAKPA